MNEQQKQRLAEMPSVNPHRPYDDDKPDGYLASFRDWAEDNEPAVRWFLENHAEIREALTLLDQAQRDKERVARGLVPIYDQLCALSFTHPHLVKAEWLDLLRENRPTQSGIAQEIAEAKQIVEAHHANLDQAALARGEGEK